LSVTLSISFSTSWVFQQDFLCDLRESSSRPLRLKSFRLSAFPVHPLWKYHQRKLLAPISQSETSRKAAPNAAKHRIPSGFSRTALSQKKRTIFSSNAQLFGIDLTLSRA
jgi:hypothetical protein